jgi:hypothetical protein
VRTQDIIVRSMLRRVRNQEKWSDAVALTSNRPGIESMLELAILISSVVRRRA